MKKFGAVLFFVAFTACFACVLDLLLIAVGGEAWAHTDLSNYRIVVNSDGRFTYQERRCGAFTGIKIWVTDDGRFTTPEAAESDYRSWVAFWSRIKQSSEEREREDWRIYER